MKCSLDTDQHDRGHLYSGEVLLWWGGRGQKAKQAEDLLTRFPMGRLGQAEDAARLVAFLASDEAGWITGQITHSRVGSAVVSGLDCADCFDRG